MVRVNIFEKKKRGRKEKTAELKLLGIKKTLSSQPVRHGLRKHGRPKRSIKGCLNVNERECMDKRRQGQPPS